MGWRRGYNKNQTCKHDITIQKKPNMKTMQLRNQQTCMISVKNLCMKSSWDLNFFFNKEVSFYSLYANSV